MLSCTPRHPSLHSFPTRRSSDLQQALEMQPVAHRGESRLLQHRDEIRQRPEAQRIRGSEAVLDRSEEHTSELQSQSNLVCRLLLEKKKTAYGRPPATVHSRMPST